MKRNNESVTKFLKVELVKKFRILLLLIFLFAKTYPQNSFSVREITIAFYNNSSSSKSFSLISYAPNEDGNGTVQVTIKPFGKFNQKYKIGTRIYLADKNQVNIVMSGQKLKGKPFRVVMKKDDKKTINLNNLNYAKELF